jgi:hypothetical protein
MSNLSPFRVVWLKNITALAINGCPESQFNLGVYNREGTYMQVNHQEAVKWFRLAAEQGYAKAQCNLGVCYRNGQGVEQNLSEAYFWYYIATSNGDQFTKPLRKRLDAILSSEERVRIQEKQTNGLKNTEKMGESKKKRYLLKMLKQKFPTVQTHKHGRAIR